MALYGVLAISFPIRDVVDEVNDSREGAEDRKGRPRIEDGARIEPLPKISPAR